MTRKERHHLGPQSDDPEPPVRLLPKHLAKQEFGQRVKNLMIRKGWNQSELARRAELPRDSISTYVTGKALPTRISLEKLAAALGLKPDELLPNFIESAIDEDYPSLEMKVSPASPRMAWLRVNRLVPIDVAGEVMGIISASDRTEREEKS